MKKKLLTVLFAAASFTGFASANESTLSDFYVSGFGNVGFHNDNKVTQNTTPSKSIKQQHKVGFGGGVTVGYYVFEQFRMELEGSYRGNDIKNLNVDGTKQNPAIKGNVSYLSLMVNGIYDIPVYEDFSVYLGVGAGLAQETIKHNASSLNNNQKYKSTKTVFAAQGLAGVAYALNENVSLYAGYRLFMVPQHNVKKMNNVKAKVKTAFVNNIEVGIRYRF